MKKTILLILWTLILIELATAQCGYSGSGDWNITSKVDCSNAAITLNGNIRIKSGGWLNATNVTFTFNNTGKANETTIGTIITGGNFTLRNCIYQSNEPLGYSEVGDNAGGWTNTWITSSGNYCYGGKCILNATNTTFIGIGMWPLSMSNPRLGLMMTSGYAYFNNNTCRDSVNCFCSHYDYYADHNSTIRQLTNNYFENVATYSYVFIYDRITDTKWLDITGNRFGSNLNRLGTLVGSRLIRIYGNTQVGTTPNYGYSFLDSSDVIVCNTTTSGSPTPVELNKGNSYFKVYNINSTGMSGGLGCNYNNHDNEVYNIRITGKKGIVGSTAVSGQPNYNNYFHDINYTLNGTSDIAGYIIAYTGKDSVIEDINIKGHQTVQTAITTKQAIEGIGGSYYYVKNVTYQHINIDTINYGMLLKYFNDSTFRDIKITNRNPAGYDIYFKTPNYRNRFINVTHAKVGFDNNNDVFDYYNYLSVSVVGSNEWNIEVYNRTDDLLTSGSTTTGKVEKLEVNEFKQTKLATTYAYPHTIKITGILADTDYNITKDGAYIGSAKTNEAGVLTFETNITDNTIIEIEPSEDIFPPFITVITPQNTTYPQQTMTAEIRLDEDGDWCAYSLDGAPNITMNGSGTSWTAFLTELSQTQYRIKFWCNDTLGHMGSSETIYFTIKECITDGHCTPLEYCSSYQCEPKKSNGAACSADNECSSNECCHNVCRTMCPYCGDGYCDGGETCGSCPSDCSCTPGGGGGTGGAGGTGGTGGTGGGIGRGSGVSCFDGIQNQNETGVDCGGPCQPCPSCFDGIQNQGEEGIDCGGPCRACPTTSANCFDGIKNQGEQGIDCGGPCQPCNQVISLEEDFTITSTIPAEVDAGDNYPVEVTIENTGDVNLQGLKIKVGDQIKTIDLRIADKKTLAYYLTAPETEGTYGVKVEVYDGKIREEQITSIKVKSTDLILRATTVDNTTYIVTETKHDGIIELEITRDGNLVYGDFIQNKQYVTKVQAGNYLIKATLRVAGKPLTTKQITTKTEQQTKEPEDMTIPLMVPLLIINAALLADITKNILRRK